MPRFVPDDYFPGYLPENILLGEPHYIETSYSFLHFRSERELGLEMGSGSSLYRGSMLDIGPRGRVSIGPYALVHGARIVCDELVAIGDYTLISWNVLIMDNYRLPWDTGARREELERAARREPRRLESYTASAPVTIGKNVWIGFDACVLPGVTIGDGAIVGARSVVFEDVPPYGIVAGNPARLIRFLARPEETA